VSTEQTLGKSIRAARVRRSLSLRELAAKAGVTASALSQLERDQLNPTLATLKAIATALNITIGSLFAPPTMKRRLVVHPGERKQLSPRRGIAYYLLTPDLAGQIEFILSVYDVGASTGEEAFAYPAEQCGLVLQGVAEVHLGDVAHRLEAGDSIRFDCSIPHRIANVGSTELQCLWAIVPPTF